MSGNTSNPRLGLSPRPKHLTPKTLFFVIAVPIAALIIWLAARPGTIKTATDFGHSVSHPSSLLTSGTKPKPPAGKPLLPPTVPAPRSPLPNVPNQQTANAAPTPSPQGAAPNTATTIVAPAPIPGSTPVAPVTAARPAYAPLSYNARHDKAFGGCSGQLILSSTGLQFNCPSDSHAGMQVAISEISAVDENGVRLASGKKLHFSIEGMSKPNAQAIFTDWFNRLR
ncbi:hypothetical protein P8935_05825 [Telmatobacter sp. DSM 110680]|uniref:PilZ domain-containing protein n=1 Tax=Telmatobacter sp. DSM 110680 TaxID=3036704 RepID=A0AAU7DND9_9BACT